MSHATDPHVITIPSTDSAFRSHVIRTLGNSALVPRDLERSLRRIFPRVIVRERTLSGEPPTWYVYRDGGWLSAQTGEWWQQPGMPTVVVSSGGFITEVSSTAA